MVMSAWRGKLSEENEETSFQTDVICLTPQGQSFLCYFFRRGGWKFCDTEYIEIKSYELTV